MITGHFGVAFALRSTDGRPWKRFWLPALIAAAILPDLTEMMLSLAGIRSPGGIYSHSLPALATLAGLTFVVARTIARDSRFAGVLASAVLLHMPADFITGHRILWSGGPMAGLRVYRWPIADFFIEITLIVAGWWLLRRSAELRSRHPWATHRVTLGVLVGLQLANNLMMLAR